MANEHTQGGTHEQHVKAGQQSHKNTPSASTASDQDHTHGSAHGKRSDTPSETKNSADTEKGDHESTRGGTHEQHVKAGQQSHKNS